MLFGALVSRPDATVEQRAAPSVRLAGTLQAVALTVLGFAAVSLLVVALG
jgi:hypothetical protein